LRVLHIVLSIRTRSMKLPIHRGAPPLLLLLVASTYFAITAQAQRLTLPESPTPSPASNLSTPLPAEAQGQILKTYPNGTKRVVPLSSLNSLDDGKDFGGPPTLSFLEPTPTQNSSSSKNLSIAPIGDATTPATAAVPLPSAADSTIQIPMANPDPMGGSAMGGSAPVDPLSGAPTTPTPLQTVSGKPAPLSDSGNTIDLGTYDDFFMNACVGGSIQGQLTARRVYNGNNMQAYPTPPNLSTAFPYNLVDENGNPVGVTGENFTFQPGFRFDVEFGYNIYDWLGVSLQSGVIYNSINQYNISFTNGSSTNNSADGELIQVPIQIDGILRWPGATAFKPFIGGGVGAIWQQLDVNNVYYSGENIQANYCRSAFQFGYNAQIGANYTVAPGVDFYGVFKLLGAFTPRIGNYDFENSYNFALEVGIQSRF
jgi:opacity protein-like surface antigen